MAGLLDKLLYGTGKGGPQASATLAEPVQAPGLLSGLPEAQHPVLSFLLGGQSGLDSGRERAAQASAMQAAAQKRAMVKQYVDQSDLSPVEKLQAMANPDVYLDTLAKRQQELDKPYTMNEGDERHQGGQTFYNPRTIMSDDQFIQTQQGGGVKNVYRRDPSFNENTQRQNVEADAQTAADALAQRRQEAAQQFSLGQGNLAMRRAEFGRSGPGGTRPATPEEKAAYGIAADVPAAMGPGGIKVITGTGAALKPVPVQVQKGIIENRASMGQIDGALDAIRRNPKALGAHNVLGDAIMQRVPGAAGVDGVEARAKLADIGSLIIHDRSGASVTISESPRLLPFIPSVTDSPKVAAEKLRGLREKLANTTNEFETAYGEDSGYRPMGGGARQQQQDQAAAPKRIRLDAQGRVVE